jgi:hypothetical protein
MVTKRSVVLLVFCFLVLTFGLYWVVNFHPQGSPQITETGIYPVNDLGIAVLSVRAVTGWEIYGWWMNASEWCIPAFPYSRANPLCFTGFSGPMALNGIHGKFVAWTDREDTPFVLIDRQIPLKLWFSSNGSERQDELASVLQRTEELLFIEWWPVTPQQFEELKDAGLPLVEDIPYQCVPHDNPLPAEEVLIGLAICPGSK